MRSDASRAVCAIAGRPPSASKRLVSRPHTSGPALYRETCVMSLIRVIRVPSATVIRENRRPRAPRSAWSSALTSHLETIGLERRVHLVARDVPLLRGLGAKAAGDAVGKRDAVDFAVVGEEQPILDELRWRRLGLLASVSRSPRAAAVSARPSARRRARRRRRVAGAARCSRAASRAAVARRLRPPTTGRRPSTRAVAGHRAHDHSRLGLHVAQHQRQVRLGCRRTAAALKSSGPVTSMMSALPSGDSACPP